MRCRGLLTVVSSGRSLRSSVTPEGTATSDKIMVEQSFCDTLADDAPSDPENVQLVALFSSDGGAVTAGFAAGFAIAQPARAARTKHSKSLTITSDDHVAADSIYTILRK
jgi:hypothetical protein